MGKKNKKFIDKRYDTVHTFKVVQRSQKDPLVADETAPQGVLVDTECSEAHEQDLQKYGIYFDDDYNYLQHLRGVKESIDWENCDLEVYTIRNEDPKLQNKLQQDGLVFPSSAFESYVEEPIGLLNKAAPITGPQLDLDPDIVAELDSDGEAEYLDPEDEEGLPDDFVCLLKGEEGEYDDDDDDDDEEEETREDFGIQQWLGGTSQYYDNEYSHNESAENHYNDMPPLEESFEDKNESNNYYVCSHPLQNIVEEENEDDEVGDLPTKGQKRKTKTNSTSRKSTSSSTLPRTDLQRTFDAYFERFVNDEYSYDKIGALDDEIIEGPLGLDSPQFLQALATTRREFEKPKLDSLENDEKKEVIDWIKKNLKARNYMQGEKEEFVDIEMEPKLKYDLESYRAAVARASANRRKNLPHVIDGRAPWKSTLTKKALKQHNEANTNEDDSSSKEEASESQSESSEESQDCRLTLKSQISIFSQRPKNEAPEDRRDRKKALKELRRERRKEKKTNKLLYKEVSKSEKTKKKTNPNVRVISLTGIM